MAFYDRTQLLIGSSGVEKLAGKKVAVFGLGGVGGYTVEALARAGVGKLEIIDGDKISESNINRQIYALNSTVGEFKTDVAEKRIKDINTLCEVVGHRVFYMPDTPFDFGVFDYVVDTVDTVTAKIDIIVKCKEANVPVISCMGAGNKLHPEMLKTEDIYKTSVCPLARVMRTELKKRGIKDLKVVYSTEKPISPSENSAEENTSRRVNTGSISFVPSVAGLLIAAEVINDLLK